MSATIDPPDRQRTNFAPGEIRGIFTGASNEIAWSMITRTHRDNALTILKDSRYKIGIIASLYQGGAQYDDHTISTQTQAEGLLTLLEDNLKTNNSTHDVRGICRIISQNYGITQ